jgi:hypothetical protein
MCQSVQTVATFRTMGDNSSSKEIEDAPFQ